MLISPPLTAAAPPTAAPISISVPPLVPPVVSARLSPVAVTPIAAAFAVSGLPVSANQKIR